MIPHYNLAGARTEYAAAHLKYRTACDGTSGDPTKLSSCADAIMVAHAGWDKYCKALDVGIPASDVNTE